MKKQVIRIAIADDHAIFRNGLIASMEPFKNIEILYAVSSGEELIIGLNEHKPDVLLIDLKMKGMDGIETTRVIKHIHPRIKVLGLSMYESHQYVANMFKAGASGYLFKDSLPEQIVQAIEYVLENDFYFNEQVSAKLLNSLMEIQHPSTIIHTSNLLVQLTQIEIEILKGIAAELNNSEIAIKLNLGVKTVENYRSKILSKTGVKNTAGLVVYGIKRGYIVV